MTNETDWKISALLCDFVEAAEGKLFILGGGWSLCGPGPFLSALAIKIDVPWSQANDVHEFEAQLFDSDGRAVLSNGTDELKIMTKFEAGRPPGLIKGQQWMYAISACNQLGTAPATSGTTVYMEAFN